jgi:hypothetical protein
MPQLLQGCKSEKEVIDMDYDGECDKKGHEGYFKEYCAICLSNKLAEARASSKPAQSKEFLDWLERQEALEKKRADEIPSDSAYNRHVSLWSAFNLTKSTYLSTHTTQPSCPLCKGENEDFSKCCEKHAKQVAEICKVAVEETTNPSPRTLSGTDIKNLTHLFNEIKRTDQTPKYEYSRTDEKDADNNGDFPERGKRWLMPEEIAEKGLRLLETIRPLDDIPRTFSEENVESLARLNYYNYNSRNIKAPVWENIEDKHKTHWRDEARSLLQSLGFKSELEALQHHNEKHNLCEVDCHPECVFCKLENTTRNEINEWMEKEGKKEAIASWLGSDEAATMLNEASHAYATTPNQLRLDYILKTEGKNKARLEAARQINQAPPS